MTTAAPSRTITFLFTDIEGSTALWEQTPSRHAGRPGAARRAAAPGHRGHAGQVVKSTGDGCTRRLTQPPAPCRRPGRRSRRWPPSPGRICAAAAARAHGPAHRRGRDARRRLFRPAAQPRGAPAGVGHGGQTLLSSATAELVRDQLPPGVALLDLGEHRLKDLVRPEHVFQLERARACRPTSPPCARSTRCRTTCRSSSPASSGARERWPRCSACWARPGC